MAERVSAIGMLQLKLRSTRESKREPARKLAALEAKYDDQFAIVFKAIRELVLPLTGPQKKPIGFARS